MTTSIQKIEQEIIKEFIPLLSDQALVLNHLMEIGAHMPSLAVAEKEEQYLVSGCLASVWIVPYFDGKGLFLRGDSEAMITKGMLALLIRLFSGQPPALIKCHQLQFPKETQLDQLLTLQRRNGFQQMVGAIQSIASKHMAAG